MLIALFGDSIANGLGVRRERYGEIVAERLGATLVDLSSSAQTVGESLARVGELGSQSVDIAIVAHGSTEAIVRPAHENLRVLPRRWRKTGWLDPRPYFSTHLRKRLVQRVESAVRWRVKVLLLRRGPVERLVEVAQFKDDLSRLVETLRRRGAYVVVVGPTDLSERFFPGSGESLRLYADAVAAVGDAYVPMTGVLHRWSHYCNDQFHPNDLGHRAMAAAVLRSLP